MSEETVADDSSHYEVSLTAGQAFVGFVLLLFSLAASFVFGLMIGKGQVNDRLVVKREPAVIEAATLQKGSSPDARIVELGVPQSDSQESVATEPETPGAIAEEAVPTEAIATVSAETAEATVEASPVTEAPPTPAVVPPAKPEREEAPRVEEKKEAVKPAVVAAKPAAVSERKMPAVTREASKKAPAPPSQPAYAQLLSTGEARTAESLAAKLIDAGFTTAYVERSQGQNGMVYRVRVKFASDTEARASADRLRALARTEPWITRQ